jgi:endoglucanase
LAVLTAVAQRVAGRALGCQLTLAATVQEEIGLVGATGLAARHDFDAAIVLEIGLAGDIPGVPEDIMPQRLGKGPILVHKDAIVHYDYRVTRGLEQAAADAGIGIQHAVFGSFGSDGAAFMRADIPAGLVAFPTRYTHTPFETAHMGDIAGLVDWLAAFAVGANRYLAG